MYNVHLTHSLLCFEFVEFTLNLMIRLVSFSYEYITTISEKCLIEI